MAAKVKRLIENTMEQTVFNPAQKKILQMMSYIKSCATFLH